MQTNSASQFMQKKVHKLNQLSAPQTESQIATRSRMRLRMLLQFHRHGVCPTTLTHWFKL